MRAHDLRPFLLLPCALLLAACGDDPPTASDGGLDLGPALLQRCGPLPQEDLSACTHAQTDYEPRLNMSQGDTWPACVSDDNIFHLIGAGTPGSAARVLAFESIGRRLWWNAAPPTADDFLQARNEYSIAQGIGSRIARRQDIHYPAIPGGGKLRCSEAGIPEMYPDRCAGPAKLAPLVNDAFQKGLAGAEPRVQAARIEVALLWYLYLSVLSEIWTCSIDDVVDCDSIVGKYNAAQPREQPHGLAAYVDALGPETHDRIYDAVLAARCWRDLDRALPYQDQALYDRTLAQMDLAATRGIALVLRDRLGELACATGELRQAHLVFLGILGDLLDRAARAISPARADALKAQYSAATPAQVDVAAAQAAIDAFFPCP